MELFNRIVDRLPDMMFIVNLLDEPRVFKNNCSDKVDWRICACGENYTYNGHGLFL